MTRMTYWKGIFARRVSRKRKLRGAEMLGTWETWARSNKTSANTLASLLNEIE